MNLYTCFVDLSHEARALVFANAVSQWMTHLEDAGVIAGWSLYRRKLNLAAGPMRDFMLQIEVEDLAQLDRAFKAAAHRDEEVERLYSAVHSQILNADYGLYRPFPDPERAERVGLV